MTKAESANTPAWFVLTAAIGWTLTGCAATQQVEQSPTTTPTISADALESTACDVRNPDAGRAESALTENIPKPPASSNEAWRLVVEARESGDPGQLRSRAWSFVYGFCGTPAETANVLEALVDLGTVAQTLGRPRLAEAFFDKVVALFEARDGAPQSDEAIQAARAQFSKADLYYRKLAGFEFGRTLDEQRKQIRRLIELQKKTHGLYRDVSRYGITEWTIAAQTRRADAFRAVAQSLTTMPMPFPENDEKHRVYCQKLHKIAAPLLGQAVESYRNIIERAGRKDIDSEWVDRAVSHRKKARRHPEWSCN